MALNNISTGCTDFDLVAATGLELGAAAAVVGVFTNNPSKQA